MSKNKEVSFRDYMYWLKNTIKKTLKPWVVLGLLFTMSTVSSQSFDPEFFVFESGLWNAESNEPVYWSKLVKDSGFDGIQLDAHHIDKQAERLEKILPEMEKENLKIFALYVRVNMDNPQPFDPKIKDYIRRFKDKGLYLWIHVMSKEFAISSPLGDERCLEVVGSLADYAAQYGVKIVFYPHTTYWMEKVDDGVRLARKLDRPNVGTSFNLAHFLKNEKKEGIEAILKRASPYLYLISINGADDEDTNQMGFDRLIQPLGKGSYDVFHVLELLKKEGYNGPIGLQCYGIPEKSEAYLRISVKIWNEYIKQLNYE